MRQEVDFYRACSQYRVQISQLKNPGEALRAAMYINAASELARQFQIKEFPQTLADVYLDDPSKISEATILPPLWQLENFLIKLHTRNIFAIEGHQQNYVGHR